MINIIMIWLANTRQGEGRTKERLDIVQRSLKIDEFQRRLFCSSNKNLKFTNKPFVNSHALRPLEIGEFEEFEEFGCSSAPRKRQFHWKFISYYQIQKRLKGEMLFNEHCWFKMYGQFGPSWGSWSSMELHDVAFILGAPSVQHPIVRNWFT